MSVYLPRIAQYSVPFCAGLGIGCGIIRAGEFIRSEFHKHRNEAIYSYNPLSMGPSDKTVAVTMIKALAIVTFCALSGALLGFGVKSLPALKAKLF